MNKNAFIDQEPARHELSPARAFGRCYFKGGSSSSSNDTNTEITDRRIVNESGLVLGGDVGKFDASNHMQDSGNTTLLGSGNTTINETDGGAVKAAMDAITRGQEVQAESYQAMLRSQQSGYQSMIGATAATSNAAMASNSNTVAQAFGSFNSLLSAADRLAAKSDQSNQQFRETVASAYQSASAEKSGAMDNKTIMILGVVGAIAVAVVFKGAR